MCVIKQPDNNTKILYHILQEVTMNIEISLQNAQLKAENLQDFHMTDVIKGFFSTLNGSSKTQDSTQTIVIDPVQPIKNTEIIVPVEQSIAKVNVTEVHVNPDTCIQKVLPKIDDHRSLNVSVAERVEAQQEQDHWKSGIKIDDDGTERYRCYYWCDCGSKGKRYIHKDSEIVTCRECEQEIYVEAATPNYQQDGLPERDNFGNFFIARETVIRN